MGSEQLICQVYAGLWGGKMRYKGAVHNGESVLWEGKWRHKQVDAIVDSENAAARLERERHKRVIY